MLPPADPLTLAILAAISLILAQIVGQSIATFFGTRAAAHINRETQRLVERDKSRRDWRKAQVEPLVQGVNARQVMIMDVTAALALKDRDRFASALDNLAEGAGYAQNVAYLAIASPAVVRAYQDFIEADRKFILTVRAYHQGTAAGDPTQQGESLATALRQSAVALHRAVEDYVFDPV